VLNVEFLMLNVKVIIYSVQNDESLTVWALYKWEKSQKER